jgi:hypothetical protein
MLWIAVTAYAVDGVDGVCFPALNSSAERDDATLSRAKASINAFRPLAAVQWLATVIKMKMNK